MRCCGCQTEERVHENECGHSYCQDCIYTALNEHRKIYFCLSVTCTKQLDTDAIRQVFNKVSQEFQRQQQTETSREKAKSQEEKKNVTPKPKEDPALEWQYCDKCNYPTDSVVQNPYCNHQYCESCCSNIYVTRNANCGINGCPQHLDYRSLALQINEQIQKKKHNYPSFYFKCSECKNTQKAQVVEEYWFDCLKCATRNCVTHQQDIKKCYCLCHQCKRSLFIKNKDSQLVGCQICGLIICLVCKQKVQNSLKYWSNPKLRHCSEKKKENEKEDQNTCQGNKKEDQKEDQNNKKEDQKEEDQTTQKMIEYDQKIYKVDNQMICKICFQQFTAYNCCSKIKQICVMCSFANKQLNSTQLKIKEEKDFQQQNPLIINDQEEQMPMKNYYDISLISTKKYNISLQRLLCKEILKQSLKSYRSYKEEVLIDYFDQ